MDLFERLRAVTLRQNREADFPDWLVLEVLKIADAPDRYAAKIEQVATLIDQIDNYAAYAGAGCFSDSVGPETIRKSLGALTAPAPPENRIPERV